MGFDKYLNAADRESAVQRAETDGNGNPAPTPKPETQTPYEPHENIRFYDSEERDIQAAQANTMDFVEWLCAVDPDIGDRLPVCWPLHPKLMLMLNALRLSYKESFSAKQTERQSTWITSHLTPIMQRVDEWNQTHPEVRNDPHHAHGPDEVTRARAEQRRAHYRELDHPFPGEYWNWPPRDGAWFDPEAGKPLGDPVQGPDEDRAVTRSTDQDPDRSGSD